MTGEVTLSGLDEMIAQAPQLADVFLHDGIFEHVDVHGRSEKHRSLGRHDDGCEQIIGNT